MSGNYHHFQSVKAKNFPECGNRFYFQQMQCTAAVTVVQLNLAKAFYLSVHYTALDVYSPLKVATNYPFNL